MVDRVLGFLPTIAAETPDDSAAVPFFRWIESDKAAKSLAGYVLSASLAGVLFLQAAAALGISVAKAGRICLYRISAYTTAIPSGVSPPVWFRPVDDGEPSKVHAGDNL
jgi:hypothetical protein